MGRKSSGSVAAAALVESPAALREATRTNGQLEASMSEALSGQQSATDAYHSQTAELAAVCKALEVSKSENVGLKARIVDLEAVTTAGVAAGLEDSSSVDEPSVGESSDSGGSAAVARMQSQLEDTRQELVGCKTQLHEAVKAAEDMQRTVQIVVADRDRLARRLEQLDKSSSEAASEATVLRQSAAAAKTELEAELQHARVVAERTEERIAAATLAAQQAAQQDAVVARAPLEAEVTAAQGEAIRLAEALVAKEHELSTVLLQHQRTAEMKGQSAADDNISVAALQQQLAAAADTRQGDHTEMQRLQQELRIGTDKLEKALKSKDQLEETLVALRSRLLADATTAAEIENLLQQEKQRADEGSAENRRLQQQVLAAAALVPPEAAAQLASHETVLAQLQAERAQLTAELERLTQQHQQQQQQAAVAAAAAVTTPSTQPSAAHRSEAEFAELTRLLQKSNGESMSAQSEKIAIGRQLAAARATADGLRKQLEAVGAAKQAEVEQLNALLDQQHEELRRAVSAARDRDGAHVARSEALKSLEAVSADRDRANAQLERLQQHLLQIEADNTNMALGRESQIKTLRSELAEATRSQSSSTQQQQAGASAAAARIRELEDRTRNAIVDRDSFRANLVKVESEKDKLALSLQNLEMVLQGFESEQDALLEAKLSDAGTAAKAVEEELKRCKQELSTAREQVATLQAGCSEAAEVAKALHMAQGLCKSLDLDRERLQRNLSTCQAELANRISSTSDRMIDKKFVSNMFVSFCEKSGSQKEQVLELISSTLNLDESERYSVGLRLVSPTFQRKLAMPRLRRLLTIEQNTTLSRRWRPRSSQLVEQACQPPRSCLHALV
jgi:chromosome segregation ATPase